MSLGFPARRVTALHRISLRPLLASLLVLLLAATALAQQPEGDAGRSASSGRVLALLPADSVTRHTLSVGGRTLAYTATAGTISLFDPNGERSAAVFYTAYVLDDAPAGTRPVTFAFNGGPGAASAYLQLGLAGPQAVSSDFPRTPARARLRDNPDTWLAFTDLVFIDPVGTGWSRAVKPDKSDDFWGERADAQSLAKVIALYLAQSRRNTSPKFLLGESYGGFRSVKVARALQRDQGVMVNGIVMVSPFMEGPLQFGADRLALVAALRLPSLAAAELDRRGAFTPEALAAAERFALTDYLTTLAGRPPEGEAADAFHARVAAIIGRPADVVARSRGFIGNAILEQAGEDGAEIASPYDAAFLAPDPFPGSPDDGPDPVLDGYTQALGGLFVGYAQNALGFRTVLTFNLLNRQVARDWKWEARGGIAQASIEQDLRELLALNPDLDVLVAHGRSDIVTPYSVSRYVIDHLPPAGPAGRVTFRLYKGGHMFYFDSSARAAFTADAAAFYRSQASP
ncbi:peptidase S10 [Inquilinus limosus]|uniref:S10 family peptidase n=1 Tax=Inquilinus limosus TaxID=171674 RepID=UPI003F1624B6